MINKRVLAGFFVFLFLISFASAITNSVQVKTLPYHEVQISAYDPGSSSFSLYEKFMGTSNQYGDVYWNFSIDGDDDEFNLVIFIKTLAHEKVIDKKYEKEYPIGEDVYIELAPSSFEFIYPSEDEVEDEPLEEVVEEVNETSETSEPAEVEGTSAITGAAIFGEGGVLRNKVTYYILGGIAGLILIIIIIWFIAKKKRGPREIKVRKLSDLKAQQDDEAKKSEDLREAEEELKDAQSKINAIKNKDRIGDLERDIQKKENELKGLRGDIKKTEKSVQGQPVQKPKEEEM